MRAPIVLMLWGAVFSGGTCRALPGTWQTLAPMSQARQETGAALAGDILYVSGGLIAGGANTDTMEAYDILANVWSTAPPMPVGLDHHGMTSLDGKVYVMGGFSRPPSGEAILADLWIFDPVANSWTTGPPMPEERGAPWAVACGDKIYVFGGVNVSGASRDTTFIFDPAVPGWSLGAPMTVARNHLVAVAAEPFVYVLGGRVGNTSFSVNERYDTVNDTWRTMAPMPTARAAMACAVIDGKIHSAGGETPMLFSVHEVYNIANNTWTTDVPMPVPRHGVPAVAHGGRMLVPGGGAVQGLQPTSHVDAFVPSLPALPIAPAAALSLAVLALRTLRRRAS